MTESQMSDALTAAAVAERTKTEAVLNRVAALVTQAQIGQLQLQEQLDEVRRDLASLRAEQQTFHGAVNALLARLEASDGR